MQLQSILVVGLAVSAAIASVPAQKRAIGFDMPTIQATFDKVIAGIDEMISVVNAFDGDAAKVSTIVDASTAIETTIKEGAAAIKGSPAMGIADALGILTPVSTLTAKVQAIVAALTAKKPDIDKVDAGKTVVEELTKHRLAGDLLAAAILGNLPMAGLLGPIAAPIAQGVTAPLDAGITAFGGTPPPAAGAAAAAPAAPAAPKPATPKASPKQPATPKQPPKQPATPKQSTAPKVTGKAKGGKGTFFVEDMM